MPCCVEERYQKSMEDVTWNMCSTPLAATILNEEDLAGVDLSSRTRRRLYEKKVAELAEPQLVTFDDYFYRIQRELEECRRLKKRRNHYLLRLINSYERDCKLNVFTRSSISTLLLHDPTTFFYRPTVYRRWSILGTNFWLESTK